MTLPELFSELNRRGLRLEVVAGRLVPVGADATHRASVQSAVVEHEPALLSLLGLPMPAAPATQPPPDLPPAFAGEWIESHEIHNGQPVTALERPGLDEAEAWWHVYDTFDDLPPLPAELVEPVEQSPPATGGMILRVAGGPRAPRQRLAAPQPGLFDPASVHSFCLLPNE
jgi:hypothetical protein